MNEENTSANIQEVAAPENVDASNSAESTEAPKTEEVAKPQQDSATNAAFAQMRRDAEAARKAKAELEAKNSNLMKALKEYGYQGTEEEIADQLLSQKTGRTVDDIRNERVRKQQELEAQQKAKAENDYLLKQVSQFMMQEDLRKIQAIDSKVKSLDELGSDFIDLISKGVEVETAYHAVKAKEAAHTKPVPKDLGPIGKDSKEKEFYTEAEVDKLTKADLSDPKIMKRVQESMTKW